MVGQSVVLGEKLQGTEHRAEVAYAPLHQEILPPMAAETVGSWHCSRC
jgi:hypothetical protein